MPDKFWNNFDKLKGKMLPCINGEEFRAWRKSLSISLCQAAFLIGVSNSTVCRWESGESRVPAGIKEMCIFYKIENMIIDQEEGKKDYD